MGRIEACFESLRQRGDKALIPFVTVGDPDLETTEALVLAMAEAGADIIELGVPFSDPIAEGPTIQRASERALARGTSLRDVLGLVKRLRARVDVPLVTMGYANPFLAMGATGFADAAAEAGVDGIIAVDLPPEEGAPLYDACRERGVDAILLAAPTTTPARLEMLAKQSRGFLYYVSLTGVTGAREAVASGIEESVRTAQSFGGCPVCVGFGVSTPEHAASIGAFADGVAVGSAIVNRIEKAESRAAAIDDVSRYIAEMKAPLRASRVGSH